VPVVKPLAALNTCLTASGQLVLSAGKQIRVVGAPFSTNTVLRNSGTVDGNAEAQTVNPAGTVTGTLTVPGTVRPMPDASVFSDYVSKATAVPYAATIEKVVLGPGCNPLGPTDPNGLYVINTGGGNLTLRNCRIYGTLIILAGTHNVNIDNTVFMQNHRSNFPVLLVEGYVNLTLKSITDPLSEAACDTNFNPTGAPYNGTTDSDKNDQYPNEIRGLIHVKGSLTLTETTRIIGTVICDGAVDSQGMSTIAYDAGLYANPPKGYTYVEGMKVSPGTWKQVVQ